MINSDDLKHAIAPHLGATLTPEVAALIFAQAIEGRDRSINLAQFQLAWLADGHYIAAAESFREVLPELHRLHERHFAETERYRAHQGMHPDYEAIKADERAGVLIQFTLREAATMTMVGNARFYLQRSRHTGARCAQEDTYYVEPEHRKGLLALSFWRYAEKCLAALDVVEIRTDSKLPPGCTLHVSREGGDEQQLKGVHRLNKRMGYEPVALKFVKALKGETNVL